MNKRSYVLIRAILSIALIFMLVLTGMPMTGIEELRVCAEPTENESTTDTDDSAYGDVYVDVDIDLSNVENKLDESSKLQEAGNTLTGYILQSVDGTNEYLATIVNNTGTTNVLLNDIKGLMGTKGTASITEVYSINNTLPNCYYKPLEEELYMLEEFVLYHDFASAYTGFFDLNAGSPYTGNKECRELEILGYDFLLSNESYSGGGASGYKAEVVTDFVSKRTAVMNVYKALGIEIQKMQLYPESVSKDSLINSPAIKDLSWIVNDIDSSRGKMNVFITRTDAVSYAEKAMKDLHLSSSAVSNNLPITRGDFIVLVASMMDFYGEPVISDEEMCALLQVFGGNIPSSLSGAELKAYVYLRARGILTEEMKTFNQALTLDDMLTILMRVKDVDSRENLKEIQITMDISDNLKSAGYFPKKVSLNSGKDAIQVKKDYYYEDVVYYDYFLDKASTGFTSDNIYIPVDIVNYKESRSLNGFTYKGIKNVDGKEYYHFQIYIAATNTDYFNNNKIYTGTSETFLVVEENANHFVAVKQGGGVYSVNKAEGSIYTTARQNFGAGYDGYVDMERSQITLAKAESYGILRNITESFKPMTVMAAQSSLGPVDYNNLGKPETRVQLTIHNWSNVNTYAGVNYEDLTEAQKTQWEIYQQVAAVGNDTVTLLIHEPYVDVFLQNIERNSSVMMMNPAVTAISNVTGDSTLLDVDDLVNMGLIFKTNDIWSSASESIVLDTMYGRVILDDANHLVVAGTTMYRVPADTHLYMADPYTGKFYVDFRAVYGWSANICNLTVTSTGDSYAVNIKQITELEDSSMYFPIERQNICINKVFSSINYNRALGLPKGVFTNNKMLLMSSNYALANWMILEGKTSDYLYVFYHKRAFESLGLEVPSSLEVMKSRCYPYSSVDEDWVVREVELFKTRNSDPGKMYYDETYGYLYNIPTESQFTLEGYLNGDYLLPLYASDLNTTQVVTNMNVNIWSGLPYGTRPINLVSTVDSTVDVVDWKGNITKVSNVPNIINLEATPAGVQALFGEYDLRTVYKTDMYSLAEDESNSSSIVLYYGTTPVTHITSTNTTTLHISSTVMSNGNFSPEYKKVLKFNENNAFYEMAKWKLSVNSDIVHRRFICFDELKKDAVISDVVEEDLKDIETKLEITDAGYEGTFSGFDEFSVQWLLNKIDEGSSLVLLITVKIIPMIMLVALTILIGFIWLRDNKIIRIFADKVFDPVKVLTLGRKNIHELNKATVLISLMLGYIAFVMIADGNILKIIMWLAKLIDEAMKALR